MKTIDWSRLFEIRKTQSPNVELVKTPLEFPGTNDQVVVRVRKSPNGFLVDDGGDAEWFIETSGFSLESASVATSKKHLHETLGVEFNDDFVLFQRVVTKDHRRDSCKCFRSDSQNKYARQMRGKEHGNRQRRNQTNVLKNLIIFWERHF